MIQAVSERMTSVRVTQIMLAKEFGGAQRHFVDLSLELARRGVQVQVICHPTFAQLDSFRDIEGLRVDAIPVMSTWDPLAAWRVNRLLRSFKPHLVHGHLARACFVAGRSTREHGIPLLANTHNYVKLKYYRGVKVFVVPTKRQRDYLLREGIDSWQVALIPHFCRLPVMETEKSTEEIRFLTLGRMVEKKGFGTLLRAFHLLLGKGNKASLIIGGTGPGYPVLRRMIDELGLNEHVHCVGWVDSIANFLDGGDIFVLPSHDEPFGIVLLEAMSRSVPIIATRAEGPLEILNDDTAYLVKIGDPIDLCNAMSAAMHNREGRKRKAAKAVFDYKNKYCEDVVVPQYEALYHVVAPEFRT